MARSREKERQRERERETGNESVAEVVGGASMN